MFAEAAVVVPARDEALTIEAVVSSVVTTARVYVVDDGSVDETGALAERAGAVVVRHHVARGYDAALSAGLAAAYDDGCRAFVTMDADGQHPPEIVEAFLRPILDGEVDIVLGTRSAYARLSERLFGAYTRRRFGVDDILCGMKAYSRSVYGDCRGESSKHSIGTALSLCALRRGARVSFVPVAVRPRVGRSRFGPGLSAELRILRAFAAAVIRDAGRVSGKHG